MKFLKGLEVLKVYELKKGMKLNRNGEILTFEGIFGDKAIFLDECYQEVEFDDYLDIDEIGEIVDKTFIQEDERTLSLF